MSYQINIQNDKSYPIDAERLIQAIQTVLNAHEVSADTGLTVVVTDNDEVQSLNEQHRGISAPTDVLSFPADPLPEEIADEVVYIGDLIIAYPYASAQAEREKHAFSDSLALLVIHGTLHLLGYDHDTPENRADMWSAQADALDKMNIDSSIVPALEGDLDD